MPEINLALQLFYSPEYQVYLKAPLDLEASQILKMCVDYFALPGRQVYLERQAAEKNLETSQNHLG